MLVRQGNSTPYNLAFMMYRFAIVPNDCPMSDAEFFTTEAEAHDAALDWSVELHGKSINILDVRKDHPVLLYQTWT